jgi:hypothetical protein
MPVPLTASAALKMISPRKNFGAAAAPNYNRYTALQREASPAPDDTGRPRSDSVKRKHPEGPSFADIAAKNVPIINTYDVDDTDAVIDDLTLDVVKVRSLLDKAAADANELVTDPGTVTVLGTMCEAMRQMCSLQDKLATNQLRIRNRCNTGNSGQNMLRGNSGPNMTDLGAIHKKVRQDVSQANSQRTANVAKGSTTGAARNIFNASGNNSGIGTGGAGGPRSGSGSGKEPQGLAGTSSKMADSEPDPVKRKFREAIKDSEKSTLVFNLNLGRIPIMNTETMNKRATLALASLAAKKENLTGSAPCNDTVEAIDDALSVASNVQFYGKGTKTYRNPKDPLSGLYCTAPVKYDFEDKEIRFAAEKVLRTKCGVNCAVPYPTMVRECVKQIVAEVKKTHPTNFVQVKVDTNKYVFRIARKPPKDDPDPDWKYDYKDVPIPPVAMDLTIRQVPKGFKLVTIPPGQLVGPTASPNKALETNSTVLRNQRQSTDEMSVSDMHE